MSWSGALNRQLNLIGIDSCVGQFSEPALESSAGIDVARITPLERWDVDSAAAGVSHRPGSRFGR
jgi:hypothetical protein